MGLIILAAIGVLIYFLLRNGGLKIQGKNIFGETPLDILKKRYAKGDISTEEFEQLKKELE